MDALTKVIAQIFPSWGAKRIAAHAKVAAATRMYDAIRYSPYRQRRGSQASGDAVMQAAKGGLREYARWLDENHDLATGVLDDLVANIIGQGAGVEPIVRDKKGNLLDDVNASIKELWQLWWESPEVTGELSGPDLERILCRSWLRDGEVFVQHVTKDSAPYTTNIPYSLEPLESDFVPFDLFDAKDGVTHGVQKNTWGKPIGYWTYKYHPGDIVFTGNLAGDLKFIPAENMIHLKLTSRFHQTRGASVFHSVFTRLDDIKDYEESERIAARVAAAFTAYIQKSADYSALDTDPQTGARSFEMAPGMVFDNLLPGESVGTISSNRPNTSLGQFRDTQMRAVAAGTGTRYSSISRNYNGTYSSQRQELVEGSVHYRKMFSYMMYRFYLPVWRRFIDASLLSNELSVPSSINRQSLYHPEFRPPTLPWIDPLKEMEAYKVAMSARIKSRYQAIRDMGSDPQTVDSQIESDPYFDAAVASGNTQQPQQNVPSDQQPADNTSKDNTPDGETTDTSNEPSMMEEAA